MSDSSALTIHHLFHRAHESFVGRLTSGDLHGEPDLLELRNGRYIPGDIKSGSGFDGDESDAKLKKHYACQLGHYVLILDQLGCGDGSRDAFVVDTRAAHYIRSNRAPRRAKYGVLVGQLS
jgi:hypothetical protein